MASATAAKAETGLAELYAADLLHSALLEAGEPVKASEAAKSVGLDSFELRLARVVFSLHPGRFTATDRRWTVWSRFADPTRTTERNLREIIETCGRPVSLRALALEMSAITGRPSEIFEESLPRYLSGAGMFFQAADGRVGLSSWLLNTESDSDEDVAFDNYVDEFDLAALGDAASGLACDRDAVVAALDAAGGPVKNLALQFAIWRKDPARFNALKAFNAVYTAPGTFLLSDGCWIGPKTSASLQKQFAELSEREVEENFESQPAEVLEPLVISEADQLALVERVLAAETASRAQRLLEDVFEVTPSDATWAGDLETVTTVLRSDPRIVWVGADRFLPQGAIPGYVLSVPENLHIPQYHYTDDEGNEVDLLLEEDGYDGGLDREIRTAAAQDVLDDDPVLTDDPFPPATARCVLKFHHKEIGTLPLCQLPGHFFPDEAKILQADMLLPNGQKLEVWVNNETRLLYGLLDWYNTLPVDSGAVFYLERQAPDRYVLTYGEETEPSMFISRNRLNELLDLGRRADEQQLPSFEILREIMEHYRKGIEFITLHTEANICRRIGRHMTASLLSGYHCFFQRGRSWVFDAKKQSQGFDKSKRKYLKK